MRVFLLKDVKDVGRRHEIKEVSDGFGRNFLIARALAEPVTSANMLRIKKLQEASFMLATKKHNEAKQKLSELAGTEINLKTRANDEGHLFAAIHEKEILETLAKEKGHIPDDIKLKLSEPVKSVGKHPIKLEAGKESALITLNIIPTS